MPQTTQDSNFWQKVAVETNTLYRADFSTFSLWLKRSGEDWYIATRQSEEASGFSALRPIPDSGEFEDLSFRRWVVGRKARSVRFVPVMPDRSVVVRPETALAVAKARDALFFLTIPVWIRVVTNPPEGTSLGDFPTQILSNTWFGQPTAGELCYALHTRARRNIADLDPSPCGAICPLSIQNRATRELNFERLCVRVEHLELYRSGERLWSNQLSVRFQGEEQSSQVTIGKGAPKGAANPVRMCEARKPGSKTLLEHSFSFLRSLTGTYD